MDQINIGIIGLGKLGLPMLSAFVKQGFNVTGFDINKSLIKKLRDKQNPYKEPGIDEIIEKDDKWENRFFYDLNDFVITTDCFFLIVPTPTNNDIFEISYLEKALSELSHKLDKLNKTAIVTVTSTVNPGDCDKMTNKHLKNKNISLVYSPEFIALGSVLQDMLNPEIVLLGGDDDQAIDRVFSIYTRLYNSYPEYHRLSFLEAEVAKISVNSFVTTKISFANMIGSYVEKKTQDRSSAQKVLNAIGGDTRIGRKYFKYGTSFGGPCFPRDNRALANYLKQELIDSSLPRATDEINNFLIENWIKKIDEENYDAIVLIGVAYKSGTDFIEESFMLKIAYNFKNKLSVFYNDPICEIKELDKISSENCVRLLSNKNKILALNNYGTIDLSKCKNVEIVNLWQ